MSIFDQLERDGGKAQLDANSEYCRRIVISKDTEIIGNGATIWSSIGPVFEVKSGVTLKLSHVNIELVTPLNARFYSQGEEAQNIAIKLENTARLETEEVYVKGGITGLYHGEWDFPAILTLGTLKPRTPHEVLMTLCLPQGLRLKSLHNALKVTLEPSEIAANQTFKITLDGMHPNEVTRGMLSLEFQSGLSQLVYLHASSAFKEEEGLENNSRVIFVPQIVTPISSTPITKTHSRSKSSKRALPPPIPTFLKSRPNPKIIIPDLLQTSNSPNSPNSPSSPLVTQRSPHVTSPSALPPLNSSLSPQKSPQTMPQAPRSTSPYSPVPAQSVTSLPSTSPMEPLNNASAVKNKMKIEPLQEPKGSGESTDTQTKKTKKTIVGGFFGDN